MICIFCKKSPAVAVYFRAMHMRLLNYLFILTVCISAVAPLNGQIFSTPYKRYENSPASSTNLNAVKKPDYNNSRGNSQNTRLDTRTFGSITQNFLDSVREISQNEIGGFYKVNLSLGWTHTEGRQCIYVKRGNQQFGTLEGRLIAVDQEGIYLYNSVNDIFRYVHFNNIEFIRRGRTWEKKIVRDALLGAAAGGVIGGLASVYDLEYFFVLVIAGASTGGIMVPIFTFIPEAIVHAVQNTDPQIKSKIEYNKQQMGYYMQMVNQDRMRYGSRILYSDFPRAIETDISPSPVLANTDAALVTDTPSVNSQNPVNVSPEPARDGVGIVQQEIKTSSEKEVIKQESTPAPIKVVERLSAFKEGKFIAAAWMYKGFSNKGVDVKLMMRMFPNLRFDRLSEEDAPAFRNKDEVRYAAMTICTQMGYDFTKVVVFSESQETDLTQSLPFYNVETVASNTLIKSKALTETDEFNLQFLYDLLKSMP